MPQLIVVCGDKNTGKTSWVSSLVTALRERGCRVGTVKHTHHEYAVVGKDTTRHQDAGSERTVLVSPKGGAVYDRWDDEPRLTELVDRYFGDFDVVLAEGYRQSDLPKIVVGPESKANPENILVRVSRASGEAPTGELEDVVGRILERFE